MSHYLMLIKRQWYLLTLFKALIYDLDFVSTPPMFENIIIFLYINMLNSCISRRFEYQRLVSVLYYNRCI